jgi:hypothetical protein
LDPILNQEMDPYQIARHLLTLFNEGEEEELVKLMIATNMGGECSTSDWLAILEALFDLRNSTQGTHTLH